jgi:hypothetical protein
MIIDLIRDIAASGGMPQYYTIRMTSDKLPMVDQHFNKPENWKWNTHNPLLWRIVQMQAPPDWFSLPFDNFLLCLYLQYHLRISSFKEKAPVNEFLYRWVAGISAFSEMMVTIHLSRPQVNRVELKEVKRWITKEKNGTLWPIFAERNMI